MANSFAIYVKGISSTYVPAKKGRKTEDLVLILKGRKGRSGREFQFLRNPNGEILRPENEIRCRVLHH
jgi:hypothetical protein